MKYLNKIVILIVLMFATVSIKAQDDFDVKLSETEINKTLDAIIAARGLNFGQYNGGLGVDHWIANISSAHIDIQPNNQVNLVVDDMYFLVVIELAIFDFTTTAHLSGTINGDFVMEGDETDGYNIVFKSSSVNLSTWGDLGGLPGYIANLFYTDDLIAYIPDINLSLTDITPAFFTEAFNLGTPPISSDNESVYLNFNVIGDRFITVANKLLIPNSNAVTNKGDVYHLENSNFIPYPSGFEFAWDLNSSHTIKPEDNGINYEEDNNNHYKYDIWQDDEQKPAIRQILVDDDGWYNGLFKKSYNVNFSANYEGTTGNYGNININGNNFTFPKSEYVFAAPEWEQVSVNSDFMYNDHNYVFQNWSNGNVNTTINVSPSSPMNLTANYKGTQLSNNVNAYSSGSQRKFIKVPYTDYLVSTYESMDRIWLEGSTDNGITWSILNDGQPINGNTVAKNPSLGVVGDCRFAVVYQENSSGNKIKIKVIEICGPSTIVEFDGVVDAIDGNYDANPVVAIQDVASNSSNLYLIVWDENYVNSFSDPGLHYRILERNSSGNFNFLSSPGKISNTDASSLNPSLAADFRVTSSPESHLAWQQDVNISTKKIKYYKLKMNYSNNTLDQLDYYEPSSGSGFSKNYNPSITVVNNGTPRLSWIGYRITDVLEKIGKNSNLEAQGTSETRAILRYRAVSGVWYGTFYKLGSEVYNVNIAYVDNYSRKYIMGWSSGSGSSFTNSYIKGYTSPIYSFGTTGKYLQVSNSYDVNTLWGNSFQNSTAPYSFTTSYNGSPQKTNTLPNNVGREGVVRKGDVQFFFTFGDITADNELIDFAEFKDSLRINNLNKLNRNLITKPFEINSKSTLTFSVSYGITDSLFTENEFESDESVNFHVELVDSKTNNVIGVYSDVTYNKSHLEPSKSIAYEIDSEGIGEKTVELRLVVEDKTKDTKYSLAELHSNERILGKSNYKKVTFNGELKINNYSLSQNYPNPFNPSTTIIYQLPKDGIVTLKVYDTLGKEVTTLVNQFKQIGRYNIIFDGSNLASGIYFYKITAGDFSDTKKFILMK